jgi:cytoskeletal protein CcmA (bactofilin family)
VIHGTINGDIIATQRLELGRAAKVNGNIQTPSLIIEQGAIFEGSCKMVQMSAAGIKKKESRRLTNRSTRRRCNHFVQRMPPPRQRKFRAFPVL